MSPKRHLTVTDVLHLDTFQDHYGPCFAFSPNGSLLAFTVQRSLASGIRYGRPFLAGNDRAELFLADLATGKVRPVPTGTGKDVGIATPVWSPDGTSIAVSVADAHSVRVAIVNPMSGEIWFPTKRNISLVAGGPAYVWLGSNQLLCALLPENTTPLALDVEIRGPILAQKEWSKAWAGKEPTASVLDVLPNAPNPMELPSDPAPEFTVFTTQDGSARPLLEDEITPDIEAFRRRFDPRPPADVDPPGDTDTYPDWIQALQPLTGRLVAAHEGTRQAAFLVEDGQGSRVVIVRDTDKHHTEIFRANTHLQEVRAGEVRDLEYQRADGQRMMARLLLPPDYAEGERRPAVVWVYPGDSPGATVSPIFKTNFAHQFNLQLLAAKGYVVIEPSLPLPDTSEPLDILPMLAQGVVPAVKAVAEAGYIDLDQVHVMGQSMGGWAAMSLLATTDLFRSGIALAGIYNLISFHGSCDPRFRYHGPGLHGFKLAQMCERYWRLGGPPWRELDRYVRNSPLFLAEQIAAPVMIVQGDQDYSTISQGEEMFSALRQLGKPARFVRYWGEGHLLSSPANIQDLWRRIFSWLDEHSSGDRIDGS